jgi:hypothetical protein
MECEKRAVRDFHGAVKSEGNREELFAVPTDRPTPNMVGRDTNDLEMSHHLRIEIPETNLFSVPIDRPTPMPERGTSDTKLSQHQKINIPESNP